MTSSPEESTEGLPSESPLIGLLCLISRQHLFQQLRYVDRIFHRRVQLEAELRRELEVLEPAAQLVADEPSSGHEAGDRLLLLLRVSEHAHTHTRLSQVRRHANRSDAHEPDPGVLELAPNDGHDLLANLFPDLIRAVAGLSLIHI